MDATPSPLDIILQALARLAENTDPQARDMKGFLKEYKSLLRGTDTVTRKAILAIARMLYSQAANLDYDIASNGEASVISKCCDNDSVVFDVGANKGDWSKAVLSQYPKARIHCFEIVPATARLLADGPGRYAQRQRQSLRAERRAGHGHGALLSGTLGTVGHLQNARRP